MNVYECTVYKKKTNKEEWLPATKPYKKNSENP
jgi:uncharacterized cysteine cluster protein YcgN (CxxCxxCC family)